jgi:hypothetical protein
MTTVQRILVCTIAAATISTGTISGQAPSPASQGLEKLKALEGDWIDVEGVFGAKGAVAVTYRVTSGGHTVVETFPVNTPGEMVTLYHVDGKDLVLTHYCSSANQPRMRSTGLDGNALTFDFDGGTNIDVAKTGHMHSARIEFVSADEIRSTWHNWRNGKPVEQGAVFRIVRKK